MALSLDLLVTRVNLQERLTLDGRGRRIERLPESINLFVNLQELLLSDNQLAALPESIGQLVALEYLDLSGARRWSKVTMSMCNGSKRF